MPTIESSWQEFWRSQHLQMLGQLREDLASPRVVVLSPGQFELLLSRFDELILAVRLLVGSGRH